MVGRIAFTLARRHRKVGFVVIAMIFAAIGARSFSPRELFHEMYPLEPVRQDAFRICDEADPTFVRAVGSEREACYNKMPHIMAVAMGRVKPGGALSMEALTDPSREAELLMRLAAMPPRQPITTPRSFANTAWVNALAPTCSPKPVLPAVDYAAPKALPPAPGSGRAAALDMAIRSNLPPLPHGAQADVAQPAPLPVITLGPSAAAAPVVIGKAPAAAPLPAPDIGDDAAPAIIPLAPTATCSGV
jgi:hypothetical protein